MRPHRRQPIRFPCPWDSPGRNTEVGCHFLFQCMKVKSESEVAPSCQLLATPWTVAYQAPLSVGFSRQEYWSGVPFPPPGDLPKPGIEPTSVISCIGRQVLLLLAPPVGNPYLWISLFCFLPVASPALPLPMVACSLGLLSGDPSQTSPSHVL